MVAVPVSFLFGYSYFHTLINTTTGGLLGVLFFFFLSRSVFSLYKKYAPGFYSGFRRIAGIHELTLPVPDVKLPHKRIFSRKNRFIVKIRKKYGLPGLIILTPILLSIPLGTFLVLKYYSSRRNLLAWLSLSVVIWSIVLTTFAGLFWLFESSWKLICKQMNSRVLTKFNPEEIRNDSKNKRSAF